MVEIIISIIYIFFLTQNINTIIEKRPKKYPLYILVNIVFYTTLIFFNHTNGISPIVESVFAIILLIILPIKLWLYKKLH